MVLMSAIAIGACATLPPSGQLDPSAAPVLVINNQSPFEVVVYAVPASGLKGMRLANARSFATTNIALRTAALQGVDGLVVRLHTIGTSDARDWESPRITLDHESVARLDIRGGPSGDMSRSSFYTMMR